MKYISTLLIAGFLFCFSQVTAQTIVDDKVQQIEQEQYNSTLFQFYLDEPAKKIQKLEYESSGEEIEGELSEDGKTVYLNNYKAKSRVKVTLVYRTGKKDSFIKSPCFIDPVIPIL